MKVSAEEDYRVYAAQHDVNVDYPLEDWMQDDILEAEGVIDEAAEL